MIHDADALKLHVLRGDHLPDPESETQVCPNCGHTFGGEVGDNFEESEPDPLEALAEALRRKGY